MSFRSGFIAIIGRPNVGKSTLLNRILGEKIAIVSRRPQTTRNRVLGVKHIVGGQIVFIDTPGIHKGGGLLNEYMVREALSAIKDVDSILCIVEASQSVEESLKRESFIIENLKERSVPVVLAINKVDTVGREVLLPLIRSYSELYPFKDIVPISAVTGEGVDNLLGLLGGALPEGPEFFPGDIVTDQPERFIAAEIIREKVFTFTNQEIPYSVAVTVERFEESGEGEGGEGEEGDRGSLISIGAVVNVERDSQKGIVIGKGGAMLKRIGSSARMELEGILGCKVFLELFVRVEKGWTKNPKKLKRLGYD